MAHCKNETECNGDDDCLCSCEPCLDSESSEGELEGEDVDDE